MSKMRRLIKIFLASPGDMGEEREAAHRVVQEINKDNADFWNCQVELVGWEDTHSRFGRPQEIINQDLDQCEYFIGMMWKRWGTPPAKENKYSSGFEEEFKRSVTRREKEGTPEIALLFKKVPKDLEADPGDELKKVLGFKNQVTAEQKLLFQPFDDLRDFERLIRTLITRYVQNVLQKVAAGTKESKEPEGKKKAPPRGTKTPSVMDTENGEARLIPQESAAFISTMLQKPDDFEAATVVEAARFRLIALSISKDGNDETTLGVHDSNILFQHRDEINLSQREVRGLIDAGLEYYQSGNTPLWYWANQHDVELSRPLEVSSIIGSDAQKAGSIDALSLIFAQIGTITDEVLKREHFILHWLSDKTDSSVQLAALRYLSRHGDEEDLALIAPLLSSKTYSVHENAVAAILHITLRGSRETALHKLNELQPNSMETELLDDLFREPKAIRTDVLNECLAHRNTEVRTRAARALRQRSLLSREKATELTSDTNPEVRFIGLCELVDQDVSVSDDEARSILVKSRPASGLVASFLSAPILTDQEGIEYFYQFQKYKLQKLPEEELLKKSEFGSPLDWKPEIALYEVYFKKYGDRIRHNIRDSFKSAFEEKMIRLQEKLKSDDPLIAEIKKLEKSVRNKIVASSLNILCSRSRGDDLIIVRNVVDSDIIYYSPIVVEFFGRHGDWSDVGRVVKLVEKPDFANRSGPLLLGTTKDYRLAARVICKIGRNQIGDIFKLELPDGLLLHVIAELPQNQFSILDNGRILELFDDPNDATRKALALKCVRSLTRTRLTELLKIYAGSNKYRYYNIIHWLDFGISVPSGVARLGAGDALKSLL